MKKDYFKNYFCKYSEILIKSDINKLIKIANLIKDNKIKKKKSYNNWQWGKRVDRQPCLC